MRAFRMPGAEKDMSHQGEIRISAHSSALGLSRQLDETVLERTFDRQQSVGAPQIPQRMLSDMSDEIAGIERRIAQTVKIKVDQPQPGPVHDYLCGIKVAMDAAGLNGGRGGSEALTSLHQGFETAGPDRVEPRHFNQALFQDV